MTFNMVAETDFQMVARTIAYQANFKILVLCQLYQNNDKFINNSLVIETDKQIDDICNSNIIDEKQFDLIHNISDDYRLSCETLDILSHYMLVSSYSFFEKAFKEILIKTYRVTSEELKYRCKETDFIKLLNSKFEINYKLLQNYSDIYELRCLNNAIKHSGHVGCELKKANSKWIVDSEFKNTFDDFKRLKDAPLVFLLDLIISVHKKIKFVL